MKRLQRLTKNQIYYSDYPVSHAKESSNDD